jgi:hypothetical protein
MAEEESIRLKDQKKVRRFSEASQTRDMNGAIAGLDGGWPSITRSRVQKKEIEYVSCESARHRRWD